MSFVLIEPSGAYSLHMGAPSRAALTALLGGVPETVETGYDVLGVKAGDSDLLQWTRNPVAGAMLATLGAAWWPHSGPIVFADRAKRRSREVVSLTSDTLSAVSALHQDVSWALGIDGMIVPASPQESVPVAEILKAADYVRSGRLYV